MRSRIATALLMGGLIACALPLAAAQREQVAITTRSLRIGKKPPPRSPPPPPPPRVPAIPTGGGTLPVGEAITEFKLVRVIPISGQNPFNQRTPLNLTLNDGRVVEFNTVTELVNFQNPPVVVNNQNNNVIVDPGVPPVVDNVNNNNNNNGNNGGGDAVQAALNACNGQSTTWQASASAPADFRFAGIEINPNTGACRVQSANTAGQALIFQSPASGGTDTTRYEFFTDALEGIWTQDPAGPPGGTVASPGATQTVTLVATTGLRVRITFVVTGTNTNDFLLTVNNITKL